MALNKVQLSSNSKFRALLIALVLCLLVLITAYFIPNWRKRLHTLVWGADRKILATLVEDLDRTGTPISIFKVKENGSLFIELYFTKAPEEIAETLQNRSFELLQRIELPGSLEGFFTFMGEATNLAVANLDNDPYLELIIPSYNYDFMASLDIIKYNSTTHKYELMSSFDIPEGLLGNYSKESM